jgi:protein-tyrosine kinase
MANSPKSSLVERLVQDRLRSGDLEASAAQLLQLGEAAPGAAATRAAPANQGSGQTGNEGLNGHAAGPLGGGLIGGSPIPGGMTMPMQTGLAPTSAPTLAPTLTPALAQVTQSLVTERPIEQYPVDAFPDDQFAGGPVALELRPLEPPIPAPAPLTPFPLPGLAPSALVPPPATALPVSGQSVSGQSQPVAAPVAREPELPRETVPAAPRVLASTTENERPDLVQGPPQIDAVALERGGMVDWSRTRSRISEEFRLVQRQILRAAFGPGAEPGFSNLLMVTSARPGEGKSFTSVNLAGSIARQGDHHVLLVDADSKRDSFCYALGLAEMRGLLDLVANPKLDPSPLIVKTPIDRLSILPVGRERERSAELFSTKEMTRLIQSLGRRYADRLLVLDAPPCLSTSDPAVLAPVVGQILFVVEADRTQRDEVEASLDLIQACPNITLVLNKQQISSRYTFGAYSSYYSS